MARRVPPTTAGMDQMANVGMSSAPRGGPPPPAIPGGAAGVTLEVVERASKKIHFGLPEAAAATEPEKDTFVIKQYRVRNAPRIPGKPDGFPVLVNGVIAYLRDGKIVDETTYDLDSLVRQGVDLECLNPDPEPEAAEDEGSTKTGG